MFELGQFGSATVQQFPGFAVAFVTVAGLFCWWADGAEHGHGKPARTQQQHRGDQVPGIFGDHVGGEEVYFLKRVVVLLFVVRHEHAAISGTEF